MRPRSPRTARSGSPISVTYRCRRDVPDVGHRECFLAPLRTRHGLGPGDLGPRRADLLALGRTGTVGIFELKAAGGDLVGGGHQAQFLADCWSQGLALSRDGGGLVADLKELVAQKIRLGLLPDEARGRGTILAGDGRVEARVVVEDPEARTSRWPWELPSLEDAAGVEVDRIPPERVSLDGPLEPSPDGEAMQGLSAWFEKMGLGPPPVPAALAPRLARRDEHLFTSRHLPVWPYEFDWYTAGATCGPQPDNLVVAHAGHGINSFFLLYFLDYRGLQVYLRIGWGGVYMDHDAIRPKVREIFHRVGRLIESVENGGGKPRYLVGDELNGGLGGILDRLDAALNDVKSGGAATAPLASGAPPPLADPPPAVSGAGLDDPCLEPTVHGGVEGGLPAKNQPLPKGDPMAPEPRLTLEGLCLKHRVLVASDNEFQRKARLLQALWREERGYPIGSYVPPRRVEAVELGSLVEARFAEERGANFLTPAIFELVQAELAGAKNGSGKPYGLPRLYENLLTSQALCFNLFGELARDLGLATRVAQLLWGKQVGDVTGIQFEHSPGRRDLAYLGDRTAFDVYLEHDAPGGGRGFIGIEAKYHEDLDDPVPSLPAGGDALAAALRVRERYREVARAMGEFVDPEAPALMRKPLHQVWRDHLLAGALRHHPAARWESGRFVLLYPSGNEACAAVVASYRKQLGPRPTFEARTLEDVVNAIGACTDAPWVRELRERYLDFGKIDRLLGRSVS